MNRVHAIFFAIALVYVAPAITAEASSQGQGELLSRLVDTFPPSLRTQENRQRLRDAADQYLPDAVTKDELAYLEDRGVFKTENRLIDDPVYLGLKIDEKLQYIGLLLCVAREKPPISDELRQDWETFVSALYEEILTFLVEESVGQLAPEFIDSQLTSFRDKLLTAPDAPFMGDFSAPKDKERAELIAGLRVPLAHEVSRLSESLARVESDDAEVRDAMAHTEKLLALGRIEDRILASLMEHVGGLYVAPSCAEKEAGFRRSVNKRRSYEREVDIQNAIVDGR